VTVHDGHMTTTTLISTEAFTLAVKAAMSASERIDSFLSHDVDYSEHRCFLTEDETAGFAISPDGDLQSVFNVGRPGRGSALVADALAHGALTLDCFDGFLPTFYGARGWVEVRREPNWTPGEPDVVFMVAR
jgi:hypothetical protein